MRQARCAPAVVALLASSLVVACSDTPAGPEPKGERVFASLETSASYAGQRYPGVQLTITGSGSSSYGHSVSISGMTLNGSAVTSPVLVDEGTHTVCVTATSSTSQHATICRTVQLAWPKFFGRSVLYGAQGAVTPPGLSLTIDDEAPFSFTSVDGSFSIPSGKAQSDGAKLLFTGTGTVAPSLVRYAGGAAINVVMLPTHLSIPACSVYGGGVVALDLEKGFAPASAIQTSFLDRMGTVRNNERVVVASWNMASIPVAFSDAGGPGKHFSSQDSVEITTALSILTTYICQRFHLVSVPEASANGVVIAKDPDFAALGAHSMEVPTTRGDYTRATVVLRRIVPINSPARDSARRTVMHEFFHVLGFGHTCSWPSVMTTGTICNPPVYTFLPSKEDVAHYFAMQYARQGERALSSVYSLGPAYVAALVAKGQAELPLTPYFGQP